MFNLFKLFNKNDTDDYEKLLSDELLLSDREKIKITEEKIKIGEEKIKIAKEELKALNIKEKSAYDESTQFTFEESDDIVYCYTLPQFLYSDENTHFKTTQSKYLGYASKKEINRIEKFYNNVNLKFKNMVFINQYHFCLQINDKYGKNRQDIHKKKPF